MSKSTTRTRRRSAGEGSVYRNGSRWRGAVTWTEPDGTRRRKVVSGATAVETRDKLDALRRHLRLGTLAAESPSLTVAEYLRGWITRYRREVRHSTWEVADSTVRVYLIPALGNRLLARLSAADVNAALDSFVNEGRPVRADDTRRRAPVSGVTARHVRAVLRRALSDAQRDGLVGRNAAADAHPPQIPHRPITYLRPADVNRLLDATEGSPLGPLYALAATTGLRRGELLALRWTDVRDGRLSVRGAMTRSRDGGWDLGDTKTARSRRTIPLPARAVHALDVQRNRQEADREASGTAWQDRDGLVFTDPVGRPLQPNYVSHRFAKDIARTDVPRVRFHDLRHSAATSLLTAGVPMAVISDWLGHSGIAITAGAYAAVDGELLRGAAEAMDRVLS